MRAGLFGSLPLRLVVSSRMQGASYAKHRCIMFESASLGVRLIRYSGGCNQIQTFDKMTPAQKEDWEHVCQAKFPCKDRQKCNHEWSMPCPADWFAFNSGMSCMAPRSYAGNCSSVLHGLLDLSQQEKKITAERCQVVWPCFGETSGVLARLDSGLRLPRRSADPSHYTLLDGPIDGESGAIISTHFNGD